MDICAELTLRIARFIQVSETPPQSPAYWFFVPEFRRAGWSTALELLANAPKPLIVAPLPEPGLVGTWGLRALTGEDRARADHQFANQEAFFADRITHLQLGEDDSIAFDSGADTVSLSVREFKRWLREYAVCAGSTLDPGTMSANSGALVVRRPDGHWSPGAACPHPRAAS